MVRMMMVMVIATATVMGVSKRGRRKVMSRYSTSSGQNTVNTEGYGRLTENQNRRLKENMCVNPEAQ